MASLRKRFKTAYALIDETIDEYSKDRADLMAAAVAFYTLLSIAPLILVAVAVAGFVLGQAGARAEITELLSTSMGPQAATTVNSWVDEASKSGELASLIGGVLVLFAASRLVAQLRSALNQIFNVDEGSAKGFKASVKDYVRRRLSAFAFVAASGPVLLAVFASRAVLSGVHEVLFRGSPIAGFFVQVTQIGFSIVLVTLLTAAVFRLLPDLRVGTRSIWLGAALTSLLFNFGNVLVGLYLGRATVTATYGAAGSLVVVLLWLDFSASMFLFGAEFTQVHAKHYGGLQERASGEPADQPSRRAEASWSQRRSADYTPRGT